MPQRSGALSECRVQDPNGKTDHSGIDKVLTLVNDDVSVASAILSAPLMLSGLTQTSHDLIRKTAISQYAGDEQSELDRARSARDKLENFTARSISKLAPKIREWSPSATEQVGTLTSPDDEEIEQVEGRIDRIEAEITKLEERFR